MRLWSALVCPVILLSATTGFAAEITDTEFVAQYQGGSLPLNQGKIKATIVEGEVVFLNGNQRLAIPLQSITAVSYGTDVHHKSVFCFVPFLDFDMAYYVGLTCTVNTREGGQASKTNIEAVLKLSEGKFRRFVAVLERLTGIKAVNADKLPAIVRYESSLK